MCSRAGRGDIDVGGTGLHLEDLRKSQQECTTKGLPSFLTRLTHTFAEIVPADVDGSVLVGPASSDLGGHVHASSDGVGNVGEHTVQSLKERDEIAGRVLLHLLKLHDLEQGVKLTSVESTSSVLSEVGHDKEFSIGGSCVESTLLGLISRVRLHLKHGSLVEGSEVGGEIHGVLLVLGRLLQVVRLDVEAHLASLLDRVDLGECDSGFADAHFFSCSFLKV